MAEKKILIQKSEQNFSSAKVLIDNQMYNSSVHCSYYSCFQIVICIIGDDYNYKEYQEWVRKKKENNSKKTGNHDFSIHKVCELIKYSEDVAGFNNGINQLKALRNKADYRNNLIGNNGSGKAYKMAKKINQILFKNFSDELK